MSAERVQGEERQEGQQAALLAACAAGDARALEPLYQASGARLFGVALRLLRREDWAAAAVAEAFLAIARHARTYPPGRLGASDWLVALVRGKAFDRLRRDGVERPVKTLLAEGLEPEDPQALAWVAAAGEGDGTRLVTCLGQLDPQVRRCLLAAYCEGYSHVELAAREGEAATTAKIWVRRGLLRLKRCLDAPHEPGAGEEWNEREQLAGDFVLGTLDVGERAAVERLAARTPALARLIQDWQRRLAPLDAATPPVAPPPGLWQRVETALRPSGAAADGQPTPEAAAPAEPAGASPGPPELRIDPEDAWGAPSESPPETAAEAALRRALRRQRWATAGAGALAGLLALLLLLGPSGLGLLRLPAATLPAERAAVSAGLPRHFVSLLREDPVQPAFLVALDLARGELLARALAPAAPGEGRDYELWLLQAATGRDPAGEAAPRSLGLLPRGGEARLPLGVAQLARAGPGAALAVSLEPAGGAPDGRPSGPLLFRGRLIPLAE